MLLKNSKKLLRIVLKNKIFLSNKDIRIQIRKQIKRNEPSFSISRYLGPLGHN